MDENWRILQSSNSLRKFLKSTTQSFSYADFTETTERNFFILVFSVKLSEIRGVRVEERL